MSTMVPPSCVTAFSLLHGGWVGEGDLLISQSIDLCYFGSLIFRSPFRYYGLFHLSSFRDGEV